MKISTEEIVAALAAYRSPEDRPAGVFTVKEGAAAARLGDRTFTKFLQSMKDAGRLETVPITTEALNGRLCRVVAYRIKPAAKLKRA